MRCYNIVRYAGLDDIGTVLEEGLTKERALQRAADLNSVAAPGVLFAIERW